MSTVLKVYGNLRKHGAKIAIVLGASLFIGNTAKHIFPNHFVTGLQGSLEADVEEVGYAVKLLTQCARESSINILNVTPFVSNMVEVSSAGSLAFGGIGSIGIPRTFYCDYCHEIHNVGALTQICRQFGITKKKLSSKPTTNENKLAESLIISSKAQKFAIVRHLRYLDKSWGLYEALVSPFFVGVAYVSAMYFPKMLFSKSMKTPVHINSILGVSILSIFGSWFLCKITKSVLNNKIGRDVDDFAATVSNEYAEGAVEFYTNLKKGNEALRVLLGKKGEKLFTVYGNRYDGYIFNKYGEPYDNRIKRISKLIDSDHN